MSDVEIKKERSAARPADSGSVWGQLRVQSSFGCPAGTTVYSDWIDSTLGPGTAMVSVTPLSYGEEGEKRLIFGRPDLFDIPTSLPDIYTGLMLDVNTGHFQIALRFREAWAGGAFSLIWNAVSAAGTPGASEDLKAETPANDSFFIQNPPRILHIGWRYTLHTNMDQTAVPVTWRVNPGEGEINRYGEYTAPQRAGMYEVTAIRETDGKKASVYVVVMK